MTGQNSRIEICTVLIDYLTSHATDGRLPESGIDPALRYLDAGILNSLGLIMMVEFIEDRFGVRFSAEDLQSYEFQTVDGLAGLVDRMTGDRHQNGTAVHD